MDSVRVELVGPLLVDDLRREAARERALAAVPGNRAVWPAVAMAGRLLVRGGTWLVALAQARRAVTTFVPVPCGGCAD
ncbi:MAG: hypothetical protein M3Q10_07400 [Chloroflexota bacterium]|nr:hypothetical protein [Chloroflexota bacterium]